MITFRRYQDSDFEPILQNLLDINREEALKAGYPSVEGALSHSISASCGWVWTAECDGVPLAIFGVIPRSIQGIIWAVTTNLKEYKREIPKALIGGMKHAMEKTPYDRYSNWMLDSNTVMKRLIAKHLGAEFTCTRDGGWTQFEIRRSNVL